MRPEVTCNAGQLFEMQISGDRSDMATQVNEELIREHPDTDLSILRDVDCNCIRHEYVIAVNINTP